MLNWSLQQQELLVTSAPWNESQIDITPLEWAQIRSPLRGSRHMQALLLSFGGRRVPVDVPVLHALGNDCLTASQTGLSGTPSVGLTFFEVAAFSEAGRERMKAYALIVAGSSWNRRLLEETGIGPVDLALQGIDPTLFHTAPKAGWFAGSKRQSTVRTILIGVKAMSRRSSKRSRARTAIGLMVSRGERARRNS